MAAAPAPQRFPNVLVLTIDTLRTDRLGSYGYRRPTTPNLDRLLARGVRFAQARTVEPLTNPSVCSMFTSRYPHEHGATRNGLRLRSGLPSLPRALGRRGFRTAAFVGNWTLRDRISGLGEHFGQYEEVFTRKRWLGMFKAEATAEDLTDAALEWLDARGSDHNDRRPFLLWVHYVDPHAPYRLHPELATALGIDSRGEVSRGDRYDTEVAFVDREAGRLLNRIQGDPRLAAETLVVFAADHGESLGEHGDWGHGRTLYDTALRIPLGIVWPGHLRPQTVAAPAVNLDVAPTVLGLLGLPQPPTFGGFDWTPVLTAGASPPHRTLWFQAHKGAVLSAQEAGNARRHGLLEIAILDGDRKEIFRPNDRTHRLYNLAADPQETRDLARQTPTSPSLTAWLTQVTAGLTTSDRLAAPLPALDADSLAKLKALGYAD